MAFFVHKENLFESADINPIKAIIEESEKIIRNEGARTAEQSMVALRKSIDSLKDTAAKNVSAKARKVSSNDSVSSMSSDVSLNDAEDFTFTYEEETDPEGFFVPYVWEVIACAITATSIEWEKQSIQVFPLFEQFSNGDDDIENDVDVVNQNSSNKYSEDISEVV